MAWTNSDPPPRRWRPNCRAPRWWGMTRFRRASTMNSTVRCREESSGKEYTLTLVYPEDVAGEGKVSILAPVGTALLGLTIGQTIDWPAPSGKTLKLTLLEIEYQPEAAGDYAR